jgi:hypothetical protein
MSALGHQGHFLAAHVKAGNRPKRTFALVLQRGCRAGDAWDLWLQWCSDAGVEAGTQKRFGARMKADFAHDKTNIRM